MKEEKVNRKTTILLIVIVLILGGIVSGMIQMRVENLQHTVSAQATQIVTLQAKVGQNEADLVDVETMIDYQQNEIQYVQYSPAIGVQCENGVVNGPSNVPTVHPVIEIVNRSLANNMGMELTTPEGERFIFAYGNSWSFGDPTYLHGYVQDIYNGREYVFQPGKYTLKGWIYKESSSYPEFSGHPLFEETFEIDSICSAH